MAHKKNVIAKLLRFRAEKEHFLGCCSDANKQFEQLIREYSCAMSNMRRYMVDTENIITTTNRINSIFDSGFFNGSQRNTAVAECVLCRERVKKKIYDNHSYSGFLESTIGKRLFNHSRLLYSKMFNNFSSYGIGPANIYSYLRECIVTNFSLVVKGLPRNKGLIRATISRYGDEKPVVELTLSELLKGRMALDCHRACVLVVPDNEPPVGDSCVKATAVYFSNDGKTTRVKGYCNNRGFCGGDKAEIIMSLTTTIS